MSIRRARRGFAVYSFIQPHVFRTAGDYPNVTGNEGYPVFALEGDGSLRGPFRWEDDARLRSWIECYRLLTQLSPTARYLIHNRHLQPVLEREAVRVTARVVIEARRRYRERFEGEFYALLWPRWRLQPELEDDFVHRLERAGVPVLRVAAMADDAEATHHPSDPHPTAAEYRWVARQIAEEIAAALERDRSPSSRTSSRMSSTADSPPPPGAGV